MPQLFAKLRRRQAAEVQAPTESRGLDLNRFPGLDAALAKGDFANALSIVATGDPSLSTSELNRLDLQLRHEAFQRLRGAYAPNPDWPPQASATAPQDVQDIPATELALPALIDGVRGQGAIIVRGLLPRPTCQELQGVIDSALAARNSGTTGDHYHELRDIRGEGIQPQFRVNGPFAAAEVPVPDVPVAAQIALREFRERGVLDLARGYLGEQPALSLEKWTLRRVPPTTGSSWHQDGAFLGTEVHTLNLWIALSDCGRDASGLNLVGKRFDHIVATGTPGAHFDWDVSPDVTEQERGDAPILDPEFKAGDAVFFDHFLLHRTGVRPGMTKDRYALESWFFTPSSFPAHYDGLLV